MELARGQTTLQRETKEPISISKYRHIPVENTIRGHTIGFVLTG